MCNYAAVKRAEGYPNYECDFINQNKSQMSTHVRQIHLGICVSCYVCDHRWWSAAEFLKHMEAMHPDLGEDAWYINNPDPAGDEKVVVKQEITTDQLAEAMAATTPTSTEPMETHEEK